MLDLISRLISSPNKKLSPYQQCGMLDLIYRLISSPNKLLVITLVVIIALDKVILHFSIYLNCACVAYHMLGGNYLPEVGTGFT